MNKVSIVTVTYNNARGLKTTIESVSKQKQFGADIEYIVIDGLSTDETNSVIERSKTLIDVLIQEKDTGIFNAMNKGLQIAQGGVSYF